MKRVCCQTRAAETDANSFVLLGTLVDEVHDAGYVKSASLPSSTTCDLVPGREKVLWATHAKFAHVARIESGNFLFLALCDTLGSLWLATDPPFMVDRLYLLSCLP